MGKIRVHAQDAPKALRRVVKEELPEVMVLGDDVGKSPFLRDHVERSQDEKFRC